ncbi:hypothetical protein ACFPYI_18475 [Halomarina salina]|uniref:Twin-arginine translocation signal domain-containing protein n=1 Tax=Halomarina salina TaxID=1872699 RepID=A0ABD5RT35_9EURY|nr:hypothetical protein [Halomarina salina]
MDDNTESGRRDLLNKSVGIGAAALLGAGGALTFSDGARAQATTNIDIADASVVTNDGSVDEVWITPTGSINWEGFDKPVSVIRVQFRSKVDGQTSFTTALDKTYPIGTNGGSGGTFSDVKYPENNGRVVLYSGTEANDLFGVPEDGETRTRTVTVELHIELLNAGKQRVTPPEAAEVVVTDTFEATTTNQAGSVTTNTNADAGMSGGS